MAILSQIKLCLASDYTERIERICRHFKESCTTVLHPHPLQIGRGGEVALTFVATGKLILVISCGPRLRVTENTPAGYLIPAFYSQDLNSAVISDTPWVHCNVLHCGCRVTLLAARSALIKSKRQLHPNIDINIDIIVNVTAREAT